MKARYHQRGDAVDIVPATDLAAGDIVKLNNLIGVTRCPIQAGTLGTVAIAGIFEMMKPPGLEFRIGSSVYWNSEAQSVAAEGVLLGIAIQEAKSAQSSVFVLLNYAGNPDASRGGGPGSIDEEWRTL